MGAIAAFHAVMMDGPDAGTAWVSEEDLLTARAPAHASAPARASTRRRSLAAVAAAATMLAVVVAAGSSRFTPPGSSLAVMEPAVPEADDDADDADDATLVPTMGFNPSPTVSYRPSSPRPGDDDDGDDDGDDDDGASDYHTTACKEDCNCTTTKVPVLNGLDVVSPFHGNLLQGSKDHSYSYKGFSWYFHNDINRNAFIDDPGRYEPRYGAFCAYGLATEFEANDFYWSASNLGPPVDTRAYRIYHDYLYFFMSDAVIEKFEDGGLNKSIALANARWRGWFPDHDTELFNTRCNCKYSATMAFECDWRR